MKTQVLLGKRRNLSSLASKSGGRYLLSTYCVHVEVMVVVVV